MKRNYEILYKEKSQWYYTFWHACNYMHVDFDWPRKKTHWICATMFNFQFLDSIWHQNYKKSKNSKFKLETEIYLMVAWPISFFFFYLPLMWRPDFFLVQLPYLGLYNVQDFAQILYFVGGVCIINRNNVFHSFPDQEITCLPCFFIYYCQHAKLNISSYENTNKTQHI